MFNHGVWCRGAQQIGVATNIKKSVQKVVSGVSSVTLLLLGLGGGAATLSVVGATPALADATLPMSQMTPSYAKGILDPQPGSKTYPGLMNQPSTYTVYTDPDSDYVTLEEWPGDLEDVFASLLRKNSMEVSGYSTIVMLPGDSLVGHGAVAQGMSGSAQDYIPGYDGTNLFSPMEGFFGPTSYSSVIPSNGFTYTQGSGPCSTDPVWTTAGGTVQNLWCMGFGYFQFNIDNVQPPASATAWHFGFEPNWRNILATYPDIVDGTETGLHYLGGPNHPDPGATATGEGYIFVPNPKLQLIKEVCSTGTGCSDDPNTDDDAPVPDDQVNTGLWVDSATLPVGSTQAEWRITVKNTGNIELQDVHMANDKVATDPNTDDAAKVGSDDCMAQGANMGNLKPGASATIYCTTNLTGNLASNLVNWANANGTIPDYVNFMDGSAASGPGADIVELKTPANDSGNSTTVAQAYKGNAQADQADVTGMVPSNNDAAMINFQQPGLKLTKWVCGATTCAIPTGADLAALAGYSASDGVKAGVAAGDWVKATQVDNGSTAQWLMVATNIGNTPLGGVTLKSDITTDAGTTIADPISFTQVAGDDPLLPGDSAIFTASTSNITNTNPAGRQTSHRVDVITTLDDAANPLFVTDTKEFLYQPGNDVVNTAVATAQPLNDEGQPLTDADGQPIKGSDGEDLMVVSNESTAEVTTVEVPPPVPPSPGIKLTKWVCGDYNADDEPDCTLPSGDDLATLAGMTSAGVVTAGQPAGGWVKFVQVPSGTSVAWLMIATNIGNTDLEGVTLNAETVKIGSTTVTTSQPFTKAAGDDPLPPGGSALFTSTTNNVTNGGQPGGTTGTTTISLTVPGATLTYNTGELAYTPGNDLANQAVASGTPLDDDGNPVVEDGVIISNPAIAEASTDKPTTPRGGTSGDSGTSASTGGNLAGGFTTAAPLAVLFGAALLLWYRRRAQALRLR